MSTTATLNVPIAPPDYEPADRLGTIDPESGKLILSPDRDLPTAVAFVKQQYTHRDSRTIHTHAGMVYTWRGNHYRPREDAEILGELHPFLHDSLRPVEVRPGVEQLKPFPANTRTVASGLQAIKTYTHLPSSASPPLWIDGRAGPKPSELLPLKSGTLHVPTGKTIQPTPLLFNTAAGDFDYNPDAPSPDRWLDFMVDCFGDDTEQIDTLQEWFGYALTADTSQQKMLLMVGPRRSGKGTIARVLTQLVGPSNVTSPTTESLSRPFGLQPLLGKSLAIISDARFRGEHVATVTERLLCISGEDAITVDRKHRESVTLRLPTRFLILSNELPKLSDSSKALAGRFLILQLARSFYGNEDTGLTAKLCGELPGILCWTIEGLKRLLQRGRFIPPSSTAEAMQDLEDLASPVGAFVRDRCVVGTEHRISVDHLYAAWSVWCRDDGRIGPTTKQTFGRDLAAAVANLRTKRSADDKRFYQGITLANEVQQ